MRASASEFLAEIRRALGPEQFDVALLEGRLSLHFELRVTAEEFADWPADRIERFFGGLAAMLKARNGILP